ncbi:EF hand [Trichlorobacter thiogenes]|uniref:EF hand n=2 Tax=Trichlorobacter thiogenes TaxID=115783 RepID=A0A1T4NHW3_9BACT|nr:EF hand [Trichlorobacter thiogenes]
MKHVVRITALVLALVLPVAAVAGDTKLFNAIDTDKSGTVSRDELLKADLHLVTTPKGQQVVKRDMVKAGTAAAMTEEQKKRLFDQVDTDKSGHISKKEWSRASRDGLILLKF